MLVLHPAAATFVDQLRVDLPQSLLLSGEVGVGLGTLAGELAGSHKAALLHPVDAKEHEDNAHGTISVAMIRGLYEQTRAKYTERQVIIIDNADRMSHGAQGAFLKLLEEPNSQIHFILTSHAPQKLLPTIRSRVQNVVIQPITATQTKDYLQQLQISDATKQAQLLFIAAGLPAELSRLASDGDYFAARAQLMSDARDLLQATMYQKLLIAQRYQTDRDKALQLLDSALTISRRSLSAKPQNSLVHQLDELLTTREAIAANHNIRLQLAQFVQ